MHGIRLIRARAVQSLIVPSKKLGDRAGQLATDACSILTLGMFREVCIRICGLRAG